MDQYKTNQYTTINNRFLIIENNFKVLSNSQKKKLVKHNSYQDLLKRPTIGKKKKIALNKHNIRNPLDQIGNDDLIFNNDKLITNIKLEDALDEVSSRGSPENDSKNDKSIGTIPNRKKSRKKSLTPSREGRKKIVNIKKIDINKNDKDSFDNKSLQLNFTKSQSKKVSAKSNNYKNIKNKKNLNLIQPYKLKNINQFINKPNDDENASQKALMTPLNNKVKSKLPYHNSYTKLNHLKIGHDSDNISLASSSKIGARSTARGKSVPTSLKSKASIRFPNKSVCKNKDKLLMELQKIFGDKIVLFDDIYQNMNDTDKKNCINFLLESIKELFNINKMAETKYQVIKEKNEAKERQIKENKNEIKELKKDITKLNKIIKTNIQMNRKLSQNIDSLKMQLEKEKSKYRDALTRGRSSNKNLDTLKRNEINGFSLTNKKRNRFVSQDGFREAKDFINKKKRLNFKNSKEINKNKKKEINDKKEENMININNIKIEDNKDDKSKLKKTFTDSINEKLLNGINLNNELLTDNIISNEES